MPQISDTPETEAFYIPSNVRDRVKFFETSERDSDLNPLVNNLKNVSDWPINSNLTSIFETKASESTMVPENFVSEEKVTSRAEKIIEVPPPPIGSFRSEIKNAPTQKNVYKKWVIDPSVTNLDLLETNLRPNLVPAYIPEPLCTKKHKGLKSWWKQKVVKPVKESKMAKLWIKLTARSDTKEKLSNKNIKNDKMPILTETAIQDPITEVPAPQPLVIIAQPKNPHPPLLDGFEVKKQQKRERFYTIFGQFFHRFPLE